MQKIYKFLSDDFLSLDGEQLAAVRRLVEQLDDNQLDTQLQFERYERERRWQITAKSTATINISDGEQSPEQTPNVARIGGSQPTGTQVEQPNLARTGGSQPNETREEQLEVAT